MVPFLVDLESPFDPDRQLAYDPHDLVRFALTASDYWADRALDWLTFGLSVEPVAQNLRPVIDDRVRPQPLRHRALRVLREHRAP
jgi:hypothetical protein